MTMKTSVKNIYMATVAALAMTLWSCAGDEPFGGRGEGSIVLNTSLSSDVTVESRATDAELLASTKVWISNEKGLVRRYDSAADITEPVKLLTGNYVVEAWAGDSVSADWTQRWYKGRQEVTVTKGTTTDVNLVCKIANVVASVTYQEGLDEALTNYTMEVGHTKGTLSFVKDEERKGYFMMPRGETSLHYKLTGTKTFGNEPFVFEGDIADVQPATEYKLNVKYTQKVTDTGGVTFSISIDKQEIPVSSNEEFLISPPLFTGKGFDIAQPVIGEKGGLEDLTIFVRSAVSISNLQMKSDILPIYTTSEELKVGYVDLVKMQQSVLEDLEKAGITCTNKPLDEGETGTVLQVVVGKTLLDKLGEGSYSFEFTATDEEDRVNAATLAIEISDATVMAQPIDDAARDFDAVTLRAQVMKDNVETVGFKYRAVGTEDWTSVDGTAVSRAFMKGSYYEAQVSGLAPATSYEFVATADGAESGKPQTFETLKPLQLPNAGFEEWCKPAKPYLICSDESKMFWDSGNHGSSTMNKNVTTPDETLKHSGNYSVKLASQFVGIGSLGKFAAGNLFIGKYLKTDGTDGILGWGRPLSECEGEYWKLPTSVKFYAKYAPVAITSATNDSGVKEGDPDTGIVYVAFVDDTDTGKKDYNGEQWGVVVMTKTKQLFNQNDANVVAYGEYVFSEATAGDGMVEINIPLEVKKSGATPTRIIMVGSASRYGDYFTGGNGSTLWLDDIEFVY